MSAHETERLSAFLDRELPPDDRRAVEAHLQECLDCQARLATLRGVDKAARDLPAVAPSGYFDDFAARVLARIEAEKLPLARRAPPISTWRWPLWGAAAAAALVLVVVVPRTLERAPRESATDDLTRPEVAPPAPVALEPAPRAIAAPGPATRPAPARNAATRDEEGLARAGASSAVTASPGVGGEKKELRQDVPPPAPRAAPAARLPSAPSAPSAPASTGEGAELAGEGEREAREAAVAGQGFAAAPPQDQAAPEEAAGKVLDARPAEPDDARSALGRSRARAADATARAETDEVREADRPSVLAEEAAYRRLVASAPEGVRGWRERREEWRAFARAHPSSPRADEARVRVIEAGVAAWRAGGQAEDLTRAREDLADYLGREDARLKNRARRAVPSGESP